jgi:hypothetical protein
LSQVRLPDAEWVPEPEEMAKGVEVAAKVGLTATAVAAATPTRVAPIRW